MNLLIFAPSHFAHFGSRTATANLHCLVAIIIVSPQEEGGLARRGSESPFTHQRTSFLVCTHHRLLSDTLKVKVCSRLPKKSMRVSNCNRVEKFPACFKLNVVCSEFVQFPNSSTSAENWVSWQVSTREPAKQCGLQANWCGRKRSRGFSNRNTS